VKWFIKVHFVCRLAAVRFPFCFYLKNEIKLIKEMSGKYQNAARAPKSKSLPRKSKKPKFKGSGKGRGKSKPV